MLKLRSYRLKLLDLVVLKEDLPDRGLRRGNIGTIVEIFDDQAYEVEFVEQRILKTVLSYGILNRSFLPLEHGQSVRIWSPWTPRYGVLALDDL